LTFEPVPVPEQPQVSPPAPTQLSGPDAIRQGEDPQHRDKLIVLDVSKEQLEAAPAYRKLGEKKAADN
jgi:hypothetical protein